MIRSKEENYFYITLLQVISVFSVITLHTNGIFWTYSKERYWFTANIIESVFYFAVPVFFMISGATLINYQSKYSTKEYFKRRFAKAVFPFIIWSLIGLLYKVSTKTLDSKNVTWLFFINGLIDGTSIISIYWFFPKLFCVYLGIPLLAAVEKSKREKIFLLVIIAGFIINMLIPFFISVMNIQLAKPSQFSIPSEYLFYAICGAYFHEKTLNKWQRIIIYLFGIAGLLAHIIGTYVLSSEAGKIIRTYKEYLNVPCVLYSLSIFILFREIGNKISNAFFQKAILVLSKYTFAAYLMHWYILDYSVRLFSIDRRSVIYRLGMPIITYALVMMITYIIRKIPGLKKIVP